MLLWIYVAVALYLACGYSFWLAGRAVLWTDYVGVIVGSIVLAALWPLYGVAMIARYTTQRHGTRH